MKLYITNYRVRLSLHTSRVLPSQVSSFLSYKSWRMQESSTSFLAKNSAEDTAAATGATAQDAAQDAAVAATALAAAAAGPATKDAAQDATQDATTAAATKQAAKETAGAQQPAKQVVQQADVQAAQHAVQDANNDAYEAGDYLLQACKQPANGIQQRAHRSEDAVCPTSYQHVSSSRSEGWTETHQDQRFQ
jgi:hypothetical protein